MEFILNRERSGFPLQTGWTLIDDPPLRASLAAAARPVKSIVQDAEDWERRYHSVLQGQVGPLSVSV